MKRGTDMLTRHDTYCRCRICKPPLVGDRRRNRYAWIALAFLVALAAIMAVSS